MSEPSMQSVAEQIIRLEQRAKRLDDLCGEILASLHVNLERETITTVDDADFRRFLEAWSKRRMDA